MLAWIRNRWRAHLQNRYLAKLTEARRVRDAGDPVLAALLFDEADEIAVRLDALRESAPAT